MVDYFTNDTELTNIADAIRYIKGTSTSLSYPFGYINAINGMYGWDTDYKLITGVTPLVSINSTKFKGNTSLYFISCRYVSSIAGSAFAGCTSLYSVLFASCTYFGTRAFSGCTNLRSIYALHLSQISTYTFAGCNKLGPYIPFNNIIAVPAYAFINCTSIREVLLKSCSYIGSSAFSGCTSLSSIRLSSTSVVKLSNRNAFAGTPISTSTNARIWVPASLYNSYRTATNWVSYATKIYSY